MIGREGVGWGGEGHRGDWQGGGGEGHRGDWQGGGGVGWGGVWWNYKLVHFSHESG